MSWVRLDDHYPQHPKVVQAGPHAAWLNVCAIAYCSTHLTDGFVPAGALPTLTDYDRLGLRQPEVVAALVKRGLWTAEDGGYRVHDYLEYNPDRVTVMSRRDRARTRQKRRRDKRVTNVAPAPAPAPAPAGSRVRPEKMGEGAHQNGTRRAARATPLPEPFELTEKRRQFALDGGLDEVELLFGAFKDYHRAHGTLMKDWDAAWRSWCRKELTFRQARQQGSRR